MDIGFLGYTEQDEKNLIALVDAFSSVVSLKDIASAYVQSDRDLQSTIGKLSSKSSSESASSESSIEYPPLEKSKFKTKPASVGTVSGIIGKCYAERKTQPARVAERNKPVKLSSDEIPVSEMWDEKKIDPVPHSNSMDVNVVEFLFQILGNGFHLEKSDIQSVFGQCGYDLSMCVDKLLELSAATFDNSSAIIGTRNFTENGLDPTKSATSGKRYPSPDHVTSSERTVESQESEVVVVVEGKGGLQREILESLFCAPELSKEKQENPSTQSSPSESRNIISGPLEVEVPDFKFITTSPFKSRGMDYEVDESSSYQELQKAVQQYWNLMKVYLKAGVDAFVKKDYEAAEALMEKGNFFMRKSREADEKSSQRLVKDSEGKEEYSINLQYFDPKDAIYHLKFQLSTFSGLPNVRYMNVVTGTSDCDSRKRRRRKRLITRLLEEEKIPWTEEGNGWIIKIRVDQIDPKKLDFQARSCV